MKQNKFIVLAILIIVAIILSSLAQKPATYANKDELKKHVTDLYYCAKDSDCVTTSAGACFSCLTVVGKKYLSLWDSTPDSENFKKLCSLAGACVDQSKLSAVCEESVCTIKFTK